MKEAIDSGKGICILCFSDLLRADARALFTQRGMLLSSYFSYNIHSMCAKHVNRKARTSGRCARFYVGVYKRNTLKHCVCSCIYAYAHKNLCIMLRTIYTTTRILFWTYICHAYNLNAKGSIFFWFCAKQITVRPFPIRRFNFLKGLFALRKEYAIQKDCAMISTIHTFWLME